MFDQTLKHPASPNTLLTCSDHGRLAALASSFTVTDGATRQITSRSRTSGERYGVAYPCG